MIVDPSGQQVIEIEKMRRAAVAQIAQQIFVSVVGDALPSDALLVDNIARNALRNASFFFARAQLYVDGKETL